MDQGVPSPRIFDLGWNLKKLKLSHENLGAVIHTVEKSSAMRVRSAADDHTEVGKE